MLKPYDGVEWNYLEGMLTMLVFVDKLVRLLMKHVTLVRFAVKLNGALLLYFSTF